MDLNYTKSQDTYVRGLHSTQIEPHEDACEQLQRIAMLYQSRGRVVEAQEIYALMRQMISSRLQTGQNRTMFGPADLT